MGRAIIGLLALLASLGACGRSQAPTRAAIESHINSSLPDILRLKHFESQSFAGQEAGTGRTSVAGTLELVEDTYVDDAQLLRSELASRGFSDSEMSYYAEQLQLRSLSVYRLGASQGTVYPFRGELHYAATVDGYAIDGQFAYDRPPGNALRTLPASALVAGSDGFGQVVDRFVEAKNLQRAAVQRATSGLEARIRGKVFTGSFPASWDDTPPRFVPQFIMHLSDSIVWSSANEDPTRLEFRILGTVQWLQEGRLANSQYQRGQTVPVQIEGSLYDVTPANIGSTYFVISVPNDRTGEFYNTGDRLTWRGNFWGQDWGLTDRVYWRLDLRAN